jgi:hypothetical protein
MIMFVLLNSLLSRVKLQELYSRNWKCERKSSGKSRKPPSLVGIRETELSSHPSPLHDLIRPPAIVNAIYNGGHRQMYRWSHTTYEQASW